jgi:hypothetical protein
VIVVEIGVEQEVVAGPHGPDMVVVLSQASIPNVAVVHVCQCVLRGRTHSAPSITRLGTGLKPLAVLWLGKAHFCHQTMPRVSLK